MHWAEVQTQGKGNRGGQQSALRLLPKFVGVSQKSVLQGTMRSAEWFRRDVRGKIGGHIDGGAVTSNFEEGEILRIVREVVPATILVETIGPNFFFFKINKRLEGTGAF